MFVENSEELEMRRVQEEMDREAKKRKMYEKFKNRVCCQSLHK
jgi:hypothetical protein